MDYECNCQIPEVLEARIEMPESTCYTKSIPYVNRDPLVPPSTLWQLTTDAYILILDKNFDPLWYVSNGIHLGSFKTATYFLMC